MVKTDSVDPARIERLRTLGGPTLLVRLIDIFFQNAPARIAAARAAQEAGDWGGVERAAHALVSSAGNLGATGLQRLSQRIERCAAEGLTADIPSLVRALQGGYERVIPRLEDARKGRS